MDFDAILDRIYRTVDQQAYLTPTNQVPPEQRAAMAEIGAAIHAPDFDAERVRALIRRRHKEGRIDRVMMLSALHVVAAHPAVADYIEAARLTGEQEMAALEQGGPYLDANLASVERHRGVLVFLKGHFVVALDYFSRALERERTAENLGNVLCCLVRLGEVHEAQELYQNIGRAYPVRMVAELRERVEQDPDLALLRAAEEPS